MSSDGDDGRGQQRLHRQQALDALPPERLHHTALCYPQQHLGSVCADPLPLPMSRFTPSRPDCRPLHRLGHLGLTRGPRRALVETHDQVGPQRGLLRHRPLGTEEVLRSVIDGAELHSALVDPGGIAQTEDLVAPTVRQQRTVPLHETVEPSEPPHHVAAGPERQMIGVGEDDLRPDSPQPLRRDGLDCALGPHRHEARGAYEAARCLQEPGTRLSVPSFHREREIGQPVKSAHLSPFRRRPGWRGPSRRWYRPRWCPPHCRPGPRQPPPRRPPLLPASRSTWRHRS